MSRSTFAVSPAYQRYRRIKDLVLAQFIRLAAVSVLLALVSLFVFLFWETLPLFRPAKLVEHTTPIPSEIVITWPAASEREPEPNQHFPTLAAGSIWLAGGRSIIEPQANQLVQWLPLFSDTTEPRLILARQFAHQHPAPFWLQALPSMKTFISYDPSGLIALHQATSGRTLATIKTDLVPLASLKVSTGGDYVLLIAESGQTQWLKVEAPHANFSWSLLWQPWLYEGHQQTDFIWQTNANNDHFEPKFSLLPLSVGTFKAAFYALIVAIPLAILAAIYTACFLPEATRAWIKPLVELAEAFPTVVLGFIAGMLLAPLIEIHLASVLGLLLLTPLVLIALHALLRLCWTDRPKTSTPPSLGLMLLVLLFALWISATLGAQLEQVIFQGNLIDWLNQRGIDYRQRNGLVIGLVMGFAIMPVIFSLTEDALISVPKSLTQGAMALGASPWQAVVKVMLPSAAAGIFAAVMIGFGRALGETMILLMASGNSPVSDFSLFEGMRTLAANLAIETPEALQGSTHYRILILSATLLFMLTFLMNTLAALVRENLYRRYRRY